MDGWPKHKAEENKAGIMEQYIELAHYLKKKLQEAGAQDLVIEAGKSRASHLKFVNNKIAKTGTEGLVDIGVFAVKDKKIVSTALKEFTKPGVDRLAKNVGKFFGHMQANENYRAIAKGPFKYKEIPDTYDKKVMELEDEQVDLVEKGINAALAAGAKRTAGVFEIEEDEIFLLTSNDVEVRDKGTTLYFSIRAFADKNASGHMTASSRILKNFDVERAGEFAGSIAKKALNPKPGVFGKYDIIFEPLSFAAILDRIIDATSIFDVEAGISCFANKLNKTIASPIVKLIDDGSLLGGYDSSKFDAEGVPTQKNIVIDKGILKTYLHNTSTALRYNTKTTANAGLIAPSPHNAILEPGKITKDKLFESVKNGIYITNVWYTRFQNYNTGDFSTIPRDGIFLIENGKIKHPISNIRVSDNLINMLKNISSIANDPKQIYSWEVSVPVITPTVLVKNVNITKPKK